MGVHPPQNGGIGYDPWPFGFHDVFGGMKGIVSTFTLHLKCPHRSLLAQKGYCKVSFF